MCFYLEDPEQQTSISIRYLLLQPSQNPRFQTFPEHNKLLVRGSFDGARVLMAEQNSSEPAAGLAINPTTEVHLALTQTL